MGFILLFQLKESFKQITTPNLTLDDAPQQSRRSNHKVVNRVQRWKTEKRA